MSQFAHKYQDGIGQQVVAQLPWGHIIALITKIPDSAERDWYAQQAIENGWSRAILNIQIETNLYQRQVTAKKTTNFDNPTIGILLCKGKTGLIADYALTGIQKPIGVAKYELVRDLPPELAGVLPSPQGIMSRMNTEL
jgi:hypothetical protein